MNAVLPAVVTLPQRLPVPPLVLWVVLAAVGLVLVVAVLLSIDSRRRRMAERVALLAGSDTMVAVRALSIRRPELERPQWLRLLRTLFRVPEQTPKVGALPWWLFFVIGAFCGALAQLPGRVFLSPPVTWAASVAVAFVSIRGLFKWEYDRYAAKLLRQLPDAVQLVMSAVRVGLPIAEALQGLANEMPSPTKEEFAQVCDEMSVGVSADVAILDLHRRTGLAEYGIFAVTLAVQSRSGGRLAETLQNLAETTRQRVALASRAKALSGEARISAIALCVLPLIGGSAVSLLQPGYLNDLFFTDKGRPLAAYAFCSLIVGMLMMRSMINSVQKP